MVRQHAVTAGYNVTREQHLQAHYARTLDTWAANLEAKKDEAVAITSEEIYERFDKYLTGCADLFRNGYTDICQFTCEKGNRLAFFFIVGVVTAYTSQEEGGRPTMTESGSGSTQLRPAYEDVQAHYDLSNDFFALFQDPTRTYSCAYFEGEDTSLEDAQLAKKIDLALDKLGLQPGMTLLDVGCGWGGSVMKRAAQRFDVNTLGLTLSRNQRALGQEVLDAVETKRSRQIQLRGWEEFDEPVDRIVSIEAFEAFPKDRYAAFFDTCHRVMPDDGRMVLQTIMGHPLKRWPELGIPIVMSDLKFMRFISKEIFPGGGGALRRGRHRILGEGRLRGRRASVPDAALRAHPRHLVGAAGGRA